MVEKKSLKLKKAVKKTKKHAPYIHAVGRRKTSIARVRLYSGKGETLVNGKPISEYFLGPTAEAEYQKPFEATNTLDKYHATIIAAGGGKNAQLGAVVLGLSRALDKENHELFHTLLKKEKLLTRDPRARERRKPGQMGRARKKKQSPKR